MVSGNNAFRTGTLKIKWTEPSVSLKGGGDCVVVVPVYKPLDKLTAFEEKSIFRVIKVLGDEYEIALLCGKSFDVGSYSDKFGYDFSYCKCTDDYFKSQKSYSDLCEKYQLYNVFSPYEYTLIYQPDAWIFENNLKHFIDMGYDYIGAIHMLRSNGSGGKVGNGGFSLRRNEKFSEVCKKTDFEQFHFKVLEDCVFSIRLKNEFNLAPPEVGFEFGWQEQPRVALSRTGKLPMGCHNPMRNNWNFWREYIDISDKKFDADEMKVLSGAENVKVRPSYTRHVTSKPKKTLMMRPI